MSKGKKKKNPENSDRRKRERERYKREQKKLKREIVSIAALVLVLVILVAFFIHGLDRYSFVNVDLFPLWYVALAIGIVSGLLFSIKLVGKEHGIRKRIGAFVIIALTMFGIIGNVFAHLNHWFDTSEPIRYEVVVEDRDFDLGNRYSRTKYEFDFILNGETYDVNVPWSDYRNYKEGDTYVVEYHEGAFGVPYFMSVGWSKDPPELPSSAQEPIEE